MKPVKLIGSREELLKESSSILTGQLDPGSPFRVHEGYSFHSDGRNCCWFFGTLYPRELEKNPCTEPARYVVEQVSKEGMGSLGSLDGSFLLCIRSITGNDQHFGTAGRELALCYLTRRTGLGILQKGLHGVLKRDRFNHLNCLTCWCCWSGGRILISLAKSHDWLI